MGISTTPPKKGILMGAVCTQDKGSTAGRMYLT